MENLWILDKTWILWIYVFLNRPAYFDYPNYPLGDKAKCCYFLVLSHAQDLFAYYVFELCHGTLSKIDFGCEII